MGPFERPLEDIAFWFKPDMGKPPFKASEGGQSICFLTWKGFTFNEFQFVSRIRGAVYLKVRLEAFPRLRIFIEKAGMSLKAPPNGLPMSLLSTFIVIKLGKGKGEGKNGTGTKKEESLLQTGCVFLLHQVFRPDGSSPFPGTF